MKSTLAALVSAVTLSLTLSAAAPALAAETRPFLHPLFSAGAVLQRDCVVPVWGWASPGERVTVRFAGQERAATADAEGKWMVKLDAMPASAEPRELTVVGAAADHQARVANLLVGDVWICSGQSNMEMGIGVCNVPDEIAAATYPQIRLLTVPKSVKYEPQAVTGCTWLECSPQTVAEGGWGGFSAAGYFFGRELHRQLQVPIGLIHSSWGGTICEAWASAEGLAPLADFRERLDTVARVLADRRAGRDEISAAEVWYEQHDPGTTGGYAAVSTDDAAWTTVTAPTGGADGMPGFDGVAWLRRAFDTPADWAGQDLQVELGPVDDADATFFNGERVGGKDGWQLPRSYRVPGRLVKAGRNVVAVRVLDTMGNGGLTGQPALARVFPAGHPEQAVALAGEWKMKTTTSLDGVADRPVSIDPGNPNVSTVLFNGMIAPLLPFAIKGAIWYQGESNAGRGKQYASLLPAMIRDWRAHFGVGDFPFYIVSLANFMPAQTAPTESEWAELREAQAHTARTLTNCGLAVAIDIGDAADIHPKNKREVGRRLALAALAGAYGKTVEGSGPWYREMKAEGSRIRLLFDHDEGMAAREGGLTGFAIAGEDRKFVAAEAAVDGRSIVVSAPGVEKPVAVRYAWHANPPCNLVNAAGLPAVPFRTDDWPGLSDDKK